MARSTKAPDLNSRMGDPETDQKDRISFLVSLAVEAVYGMQRRGLLCNCRTSSKNFRAPLKNIIRDLQRPQMTNSDQRIDFVAQKPYNRFLPTPYAWKASGDVNHPKREPFDLSRPGTLKDMSKGEARTITRPPLGTLPPQSPWPGHRPQFGLSQFMQVKVPTDDKEYRATIKPAFHGHFDHETNGLIEGCTCVHICIWTPKDGLYWLCEICYGGANMNWELIPIHKVGLANFQHCPACPSCGGRPYNIQKAKRCIDCRRVAYSHRSAIRKGVIISSYHAQRFVNNPI
ncbi:hypothetical protein QAD02_012374 [Eretmocerus hayati]|uniref:Uncharacterized protein n=1 Tax=Eretmocerus hayati TaxID=131215 RepID=A0ACC2P2A1_9HYME|nr:hypothetical protein QAD02_012374 [Eretmocerus hayati]